MDIADVVMDIADVVMKLAGPIHPIGDSITDATRLTNLTVLCTAVNKLVSIIDITATNNKNREENSRKIVGEYADNFLANTLGIVE